MSFELDGRYRIGIGHDIHEIVLGGALVLGGLNVASDVGFVTPSDGDVLCHALIDALAGAMVDGDIGRHFPSDTEPEAQGANSLEYVERIARLADQRSYKVIHVDSYITLGTTKLAPHLDYMRRNVATALMTSPDRVSVKARTNNGFGAEGEGRAASATVAVVVRHGGPTGPSASS